MVSRHVLEHLGVWGTDPRLEALKESGQVAVQQRARTLCVPLGGKLRSCCRPRLKNLHLGPDDIGKLVECAAGRQALDNLVARLEYAHVRERGVRLENLGRLALCGRAQRCGDHVVKRLDLRQPLAALPHLLYRLRSAVVLRLSAIRALCAFCTLRALGSGSSLRTAGSR